MTARMRHKIVTTVLKPLMRVYFRLVYHVHTQDFLPKDGFKPPYIILANHNTNLDPFFISFCFPFPIYFVASDHIFRLGLVSRLIRYLVAPIPKLKSAGDIRTVHDIMSTLRSGGSVCVFPEGNRSWNGRTETISPAIGKLVARLGATLVLCRIHGGYLFSPRWADNFRLGRVECRAVREISPEELSKMDADGINAVIRRELFVDAMADQQQKPVRFSGRNLAQSIETVLYACPNCGGLATIRSQGESARCGCGLQFGFNSLGYLTGAPYLTISDWDDWQTGHLKSIIGQRLMKNDPRPIFRDENQLLYEIKRAERSRLADTGEMMMYCDRMVFSGKESRIFYFKDIVNISIHGRLVLQFTLAQGSSFEIKSDHPRSAYKYIQAFGLIRQREARKEVQ